MKKFLEYCKHIDAQDKIYCFGIVRYFMMIGRISLIFVRFTIVSFAMF